MLIQLGYLGLLAPLVSVIFPKPDKNSMFYKTICINPKIRLGYTEGKCTVPGNKFSLQFT
jgi:hypothetical protein